MMYDSCLQQEHPCSCLMNQPPSPPREYHFYLKNNRHPTPNSVVGRHFLKEVNLSLPGKQLTVFAADDKIEVLSEN